MTQEETLVLLSLVSEAYPSFAKERDLNTTCRLWSMMMQDVPYKAAECALLAFIAQDLKGFPPTVGAILSLAQGQQDGGMSETEAWGKVFRALKNGLYGYQEEFAKLPPEIQSTIGDPKLLHDWALLDESEVQTVIASNFQRSFRAKSKAMRDMQRIPSGVREAFASLGLGRIGLMGGQSALTDEGGV